MIRIGLRVVAKEGRWLFRVGNKIGAVEVVFYLIRAVRIFFNRVT